MDMKDAMRAYEANLNVLDAQGAMDKSTLSLLRPV
jgi:flagellar basal body rod protein FlgC